MIKHEAVFTKDTQSKQIKVVRSFNAALQKVWDAWTKSELLDKWWAPRPWVAVTKSMDFREGGKWFYYMQGPEGEKHFCYLNYKEIDTNNYFTSTDGFCDEEENPNTEFPTMDWKVSFAGDGAATMVNIIISFKKEDDMKAILDMGFEEGFTMGLNNLDELLAE